MDLKLEKLASFFKFSSRVFKKSQKKYYGLLSLLYFVFCHWGSYRRLHTVGRLPSSLVLLLSQYPGSVSFVHRCLTPRAEAKEKHGQTERNYRLQCSISDSALYLQKSISSRFFEFIKSLIFFFNEIVAYISKLFCIVVLLVFDRHFYFGSDTSDYITQG